MSVYPSGQTVAVTTYMSVIGACSQSLASYEICDVCCTEFSVMTFSSAINTLPKEMMHPTKSKEYTVNSVRALPDSGRIFVLLSSR